jgi:hypothetical protein
MRELVCAISIAALIQQLQMISLSLLENSTFYIRSHNEAIKSVGIVKANRQSCANKKALYADNPISGIAAAI